MSLVTSSVVFLVFLALSFALPLNKPFIGRFTFYDDEGIGACGQPIHPATENLVSVSYLYFTGPSPDGDQLCKTAFCLKVDYKGKNITVPIKDKCPFCASDLMEISLPAFKTLENPEVGVAYNATFTFVIC